MSGRTEFDEIRDLFRPLTRGAREALDLLDDVAVIGGRPDHELVISTDTIVAGVHALPDTSPEDLAFKLAGVSLSDLAAKGAVPDGAFLNVSWPTDWGATDRSAFAGALGEALIREEVRLFGGDTVRTPGPFQASLTVLGWCPKGETVLRSGAQPGDLLFVTGSIGDGWLGLGATRGEGDFPQKDREALALRYRRPTPRHAFSAVLRDLCSAAVDVSDGLIADIGHIGMASGLGVELDLDAIPLSEPAQRWLTKADDQAEARLALAAGGDDYEIACTAPAAVHAVLTARAKSLGLRLTRIGMMTSGEGVSVTFGGRLLQPKRVGWSHIEN